MDSLTTKIQQLPDELMRSIYLYIPDRLPFKDELLEARLRVEYIPDSFFVDEISGHSYVLKRTSKLCYTMTNKTTGEVSEVFTRVCKKVCLYHDQFLKNRYTSMKWEDMSVLRKIATKHKIKGRSKLKTRNDFIHAFLKNDV